MELEGKIALVTGAGRRIGKAIAGGLASAGADIALHYCRHISGGAAVQEEVTARFVSIPEK